MSRSLDQLMDELTKMYSEDPDTIQILPEGEVNKTEKEKMKEFFFGKTELDWPLWEDRRKEGRCPQCGEPGRIHLSTFVCDTHGPF